MGAQQWRNAQESLLNLEKGNVASVNSIVRYVIVNPYRTVILLTHLISLTQLCVTSVEEWKPIKSYAHGFHLLYQLHLKM